MEPVGLAPKSVRELIVELSSVEDGLRLARQARSAQGQESAQEPDVPALVHQEQLIVHELRRRARSRRSRQPARVCRQF
ncbi:hypothetical protein [Segeticoccus rhizosphaerae]|jgi:hypothetical protein|uniref:hypothetical protein n=1 Tax=Segeticoccus rhizosphaerae TaxID=1104777 RepID=UPI0010C003A4|nr:hypothetical protein [Ornithinicoccus soli]HEX5428056.1 hypothetical protein [Pedococcus sp.]